VNIPGESRRDCFGALTVTRRIGKCRGGGVVFGLIAVAPEGVRDGGGAGGCWLVSDSSMTREGRRPYVDTVAGGEGCGP
jgi:hypothetical protein